MISRPCMELSPNWPKKPVCPCRRFLLFRRKNANAFATGRNPQHAAVAATEGILKILDDDELSGVMAHELAHVKHRDILTGTIAATFAGAIAMLGQFARFGVGRQDRRGNPLGTMLILVGAPLGAMLIRMTVSRVRGSDYWGVYFDVIEAVKKRFDAEGITIPFPQRDVHIYDHKKG